jgi:hypothetical protein
MGTSRAPYGNRRAQAPTPGIEPGLGRLTAACSAIERRRNVTNRFSRNRMREGFESRVLTSFLSGSGGIRTLVSSVKSRVCWPLTPQTHFDRLRANVPRFLLAALGLLLFRLHDEEGIGARNDEGRSRLSEAAFSARDARERRTASRDQPPDCETAVCGRLDRSPKTKCTTTQQALGASGSVAWISSRASLDDSDEVPAVFLTALAFLFCVTPANCSSRRGRPNHGAHRGKR